MDPAPAVKIACDGCGKAVDDSVMQIHDEAGQIFYLCPECFVGHQGEPPDEQP